jgi:hypothetical protein
MAGIPIAIHSGLTDTLFGKYQAPIRYVIEQQAGVDQANGQINSLFKRVRGGSSPTEGFSGITALSAFSPRGEAAEHAKDSIQESFKKQVEYVNWGKEVVITEDMIRFAKFEPVKTRLADFISSYYTGLEELAARFYGEATQGNGAFKIDGFNFNLTTSDGQPLFSQNHPSAVKASFKQSNVFENDLSVEALGLVETAMQKFEGDTGNRLNINPDTIIIPNSGPLKQQLFEILATGTNPEKEANAFNWQFGRWQILQNRYLDRYITAGTSPYILIDSHYLNTYAAAVHLEWDELRVRSTLNMQINANEIYGDARYNLAFIDWHYAAVGGIPGGTELS